MRRMVNRVGPQLKGNSEVGWGQGRGASVEAKG
jgi:hypothetical protein